MSFIQQLALIFVFFIGIELFLFDDLNVKFVGR